MENKRGGSVINLAVKLDAMTDSDGVYTKYAIGIVENNDDSATREICKSISELARTEDKKTVQVAKALKDAIISYYGYSAVKEICGGQSKEELKEERTLEDLIYELNNLVGLGGVKNTINDLITYQKVQKTREEHGLYSKKSTLHLAFTGNPGTGKTTVARIVGRVYKQIGLLSKGHFIEVSRTDLIAGYQGQTALKVKEVIERAKGGVLFIDEAYSITENDHTDSYGKECLTELTKALEDYRDDLVVIVAGYTEPMKQFFESNPGLRSRFNTYIEFNDYSADELLDILNMIAKESDYTVSDELKEMLRHFFESITGEKNENFANGRLARNLYDDLVMAHAKRVASLSDPTNEDLSILLPIDFVDYQKRQ